MGVLFFIFVVQGLNSGSMNMLEVMANLLALSMIETAFCGTRVIGSAFLEAPRQRHLSRPKRFW